MGIRIVEREHFRIIGIKIETLLKDTKEQHIIPKLQQSFNEKITEVKDAINLPTTYGVFIDPANYNPKTDLFTWIAGVQVIPNAEPPVGMISFELPTATYAVLEYRGNMDRAGHAYGELYSWIKNSEYEQVGTYGFELYNKIHSPLERGDADFLLHFPIKYKGA